MAAPDLRQGAVFVYPYLWRWQSERGETAGRKERPVCVALPLVRDGMTHLFLLAITGTLPGADRIALEIPEIEKRRVGLKEWRRGWVILDECNYDIAERSFHFAPDTPSLGRFSEAFTGQIKTAMRAAIAGGALRRIDRAD